MAPSSVDIERVLALRSVRDPAARNQFLAAVRELGRDGADFTLERLESLMRVEEHFQALLLYDQVEYLRRPAPVPEADRELALNIQRICLEAANGFQRFLRNRNTWAASRDALDVMFRVNGLALNAIHGFVKWGHFQGDAGRTMPWRQLHALYGLAESDGYAQVPFVLHASQPAFRPSVQSLYLRTLILEMLNAGSLGKVQLEIADGWFSSWCADYALDTAYSSRHHVFFVDLSAEAGLQLVRRESHGEALRYLRMDGLEAQVEEVQAGLRQGRLYAGHGAGAVFAIEEHVALLATLEKLCQSLLAGAENRIEERTPFEDREVDVAVGFDRVMRKLREGTAAVPPTLATGVDAPPQEAGAAVPQATAEDRELERWRVHDLSSRGYGLLTERAAADAVPLNGLIALRNQETGGWFVASVVRKLPNRLRGEMLLGVEVLAFRCVPVELAPVKPGPAIPAMFVPGQDRSGKQDAILVRAGDFHAGNVFTLRAGGAAYTVRLNRIIRKGADWIKARFEIESKA